MTFILSMISIAAVAATVASHSEKLYTGCSRELNFEEKEAVSNSTTKYIGTLQLMSTVLIAIEFEIEAKVNEREEEKEKK